MAEYKVGFPVDFTENGDKTRDAIQKFINEFQSVYRYLNELREGLDKIRYPVWNLKLLKGVDRFTLPPDGTWTVYIALENESACVSPLSLWADCSAVRRRTRRTSSRPFHRTTATARWGQSPVHV